MTLAVLVDAADGPLARRFRVKQVLPRFDGALLDNVVDYLNYVVVPAYFLHRAGLLPSDLGLAGAALVCLVSAYQFSHTDAKAEGGDGELYFRGFPSYWNVLVFYLLLTRPDPWVAFGIVVALSVLVFVPLRCIYPSRTRTLRPLTMTLTVAWTASVGVMLALFPRHVPWLTYGSLLYIAYYTVVSVWLTWRAGGR